MDSIRRCLCQISAYRAPDVPDSDWLDKLWGCQSVLDSWLSVSVEVVCIGLVFEVFEWFPTASMRKNIADLLFETEVILKLHALRHAIVRFGELLVLAGVTGELALHITSTGVLTDIKGVQDSRNGAQEIAIQNAKSNAAAASDNATKAQIELAKFKAPRALNADQQSTITDALKGLTPAEYDFFVSAGDDEFDLMEEIAMAINLAGWQRKPVNSPLPIELSNGSPSVGFGLTRGVVIKVPDQNVALLFSATALANILTLEGVSAAAGYEPKEHSTRVHIMIGSKPRE